MQPSRHGPSWAVQRCQRWFLSLLCHSCRLVTEMCRPGAAAYNESYASQLARLPLFVLCIFHWQWHTLTVRPCQQLLVPAIGKHML